MGGAGMGRKRDHGVGRNPYCSVAVEVDPDTTAAGLLTRLLGASAQGVSVRFHGEAAGVAGRGWQQQRQL